MPELSDDGFFCGSVLFGVALASELAVRADRQDDDGNESVVVAADERRDELNAGARVSRVQPSSVEHCSLVNE